MALCTRPHKRKAPEGDLADDGWPSGSESVSHDASPARSKRARCDLNNDDMSGSDYAASTAPTFAITQAPTFADTDITGSSIARGKSKTRIKKFSCSWLGCTKAFDRPVRLQAHYNTHTGERPHACPHEGCDKAFFKPTHLKAHIQEKHTAERNHVCTFRIFNDHGEPVTCGRAFPTSTKLKRHVAQHEEKEETTCGWEGCGRVFRKQETLQRHVKKEHLHEQPYLCTHAVDGGTCGQAFPTPGLLKSHVGREHSAQRYICEICSQSLEPLPPPADWMMSTNGLDEEFLPRQDEEDEEWKTGDHGEGSGRYLDTELNSSHKVQDGMVVFATFAELQLHNRVVHPPTCTECGKECKSNKDLKAHIDIYHAPPEQRDPMTTNSKEYLCPSLECPRAQPGCGFTRKGNMDVHIRNVHAREKTFVCGVFDLRDSDKLLGWTGSGCGLALSTKQALIAHIRTQHLGLDAGTASCGPQQRSVGSRKGRPRKGIISTASPSEDVDMHQQDDARANPALALLTGAGYETLRPIPCVLAATAQPCPMRFTREYDLATHLELTHGWHVDDIEEALAGGALALAAHTSSAQVANLGNNDFGEHADVAMSTDPVIDPMLCGLNA